MSINSQHATNECLFANIDQNFVAVTVCVGGLVYDKKWKFLQFVAIFWLLKFNWPLINFENMKMLFWFLEDEKHVSQALKWFVKLGDNKNNTWHYHGVHESCYTKS
jgi:hypothetical protein